MSDFAPPTGPPPPKLPSGWIARWNDQYGEWFYVNTYTKQSQWDKPTEPVYPTSNEGSVPSGPPPSYAAGSSAAPAPEKSSHLGSNNPFGGPGGVGSSHPISEDEKLARQLQAEEESKAGGSSRGAADSYYGQQGPSPGYGGGAQYGAGSSPGPYGQPPGASYDQQLPPRPDSKTKGGFLGKVFGKHSAPPAHQQPYPQQGYAGGYPQQGYPPQQYGGAPPGGYYGGQPQYAQQQAAPPKKHGLGTAGGAALGLGGGLLGGALLGEALSDGGGDGGDDGGGDGGGYGGDGGGGGGDS